MAKGKSDWEDFALENPYEAFDPGMSDSGGGFDLGSLFGGGGDEHVFTGPQEPSGGGFGSLFGGVGSTMASLARGLLGTNQDGSLNLASILPLLGLVGGTINSNNQTERASEQLQGAARQAQDDATRLIGGARDEFKPYQTAGTDALARMQAAPASALAANFGPLGQQSALADKFKSMTLANLARRA